MMYRMLPSGELRELGGGDATSGQPVAATDDDQPVETDEIFHDVMSAHDTYFRYQFPDLAKYIVEAVKPYGETTWRRILKSQMVRSKLLGGPVCDLHVKDAYRIEVCDRFQTLELYFPHSFEPGDTMACGATVFDSLEASDEVLIEAACKETVQ